MKLDIEKEDLLSIRHDVMESLDIMRAFKNGEVRQADVKKLSSNGCRKLTHARDSLSKITGIDF
jgi:hypothetical protein